MFDSDSENESFSSGLKMCRSTPYQEESDGYEKNQDSHIQEDALMIDVEEAEAEYLTKYQSLSRRANQVRNEMQSKIKLFVAAQPENIVVGKQS